MTQRNACFTSYNTTLRPTSGDIIKYIIYQLERCPNTQRDHIQGYCEFSSPIRLVRIKELLGDPAVHVEQRKGSRDQARDYCRKEESRIDGPWEYGDFGKGQGNRSDLDALRDTMLVDPKLSTVLDEHFGMFVKYTRGIQAASFLLRKRATKDFRTLDVHVYWGEAGTGKTRSAVERNEDYYILDKSGDTIWFDGYDGESHLIIDDFYGWIPFGALLRILDGYQYKCSIKGGFVYAAWTTVTITSNRSVDEWYPNARLNDAQRNALARRINEFRHFE